MIRLMRLEWFNRNSSLAAPSELLHEQLKLCTPLVHINRVMVRLVDLGVDASFYALIVAP